MSYANVLLGLGELRRFKLNHVKIEKGGVRISCPKDAEGESKNILIPFSKSEPCLASAVINYLDWLRRSLSEISKDTKMDIGMDTALFHRVVKNGYSDQACGQNKFPKFGQDVASRLGLKCPELYNINCFRLSAKIKNGPKTPLVMERKRPASEPNNVWGMIFKGIRSVDEKRQRV